MPPRQQRTSNARGNVQLPNLVIAPPVAWRINSATSNNVNMTLLNRPGENLLKGVPRFLNVTNGEYATAVTDAGNSLNITIPLYGSHAWTFALPGNDPAVRWSNGAYLAPGSLPFTETGFENPPPYQAVASTPQITHAHTHFTGPGPTSTSLPTPFQVASQRVISCGPTFVGTLTVNSGAQSPLQLIVAGECWLFTIAGTLWVPTQII